ncbi:MAG: glycosyltransferase [Nitrospinota bacterium]|jgi:trehalose synthase|nr:glycosyltransferase [Nitrospinota bacterium]
MSAPILDDYKNVVGEESISQLRRLAEPLAGRSVVHVNSTRYGGGVAEILEWLIVLMNDSGLIASWEVLEGEGSFFTATKKIHNALQGFHEDFDEDDKRAYEEVQDNNAEELREKLEEADFVFIHDPQPAGLLGLCPNRKGTWVWRCHIDASRPFRPVWKYLESKVEGYDASIFSMPQFARSLNHPQYLIAPSINPLSEKNMSLPESEVEGVIGEFELDPERPILTQVSRFDRFKDPVGVISAYSLINTQPKPQLVLAGGGAADDPEGAAVLAEVKEAAGGDPDIHILDLPPDAHRKINALQRASNVIIQKSTREGFGLTVTEGMWKAKPVIGGNVGGICFQVHNFQTGFLVNSPEGAAMRIRYLLEHPKLRNRMGGTAHVFVRDNFLLTRHLREYLTLMVTMDRGNSRRVIDL